MRDKIKMKKDNKKSKSVKYCNSEAEFYDKWARCTPIDSINPSNKFTADTAPEYKEVIKNLGQIKGKKVLILGCGLGEEVVYAASLGAKVTAIDISKEMLKFTEELALKYKVKKDIALRNMEAEDLGFKEKSFDAVLGCNILHHVNIEKAVLEIKRVLKKGGIASFTEPFSYNPVINIYRILANKVRTDGEHPLSYDDLKTIQKFFPKIEHREFHLLTLFIFIWFFIGERIHPNKARYFEKIISEAKRYKNIFNFLYKMDNVVLSLFPFLRRYCWVTVVKVKKE